MSWFVLPWKLSSFTTLTTQHLRLEEWEKVVSVKSTYLPSLSRNVAKEIICLQFA